MAGLLANSGRRWVVVVGNVGEGSRWRENRYGEKRVKNNNNNKIKRNERKKKESKEGHLDGEKGRENEGKKEVEMDILSNNEMNM